jgi:enediyne biosynthesis protein E4
VHFGMGHATKADLTIRWPDGPLGKVETIPGVDANQWIVVREGRGIVERHPFTHDRP